MAEATSRHVSDTGVGGVPPLLLLLSSRSRDFGGVEYGDTTGSSTLKRINKTNIEVPKHVHKGRP